MLPSGAPKYEAHRGYRFGAFELDLDRGALLRGGGDVPLRPKSFAVLAYLVERHGKLVSKEELLDAVWGHRHISDSALTQCLIDIRRALADDAHSIIRTVPRRGYIFEPLVAEIDGWTDSAPAASAGSTGRQLSWAVTLVLVLSITVLGWRELANRGVNVPFSGLIDSTAPVKNIAVLPFLDLSPRQDHEYLADGLTEELLHVLTKVPGLRVTARTSAFAFQGSTPDIPTVAQKLGVDHVLEGSVRKSGNHLRITAQLVDVDTNSHVWSRTFDRELGDIIAIQTEIATAVADSLRLASGSQAALITEKPSDPIAFEHYLRGRFFWNRAAAGDTDRARKSFIRAVEIDPAFGRAWAGLAGVHYVELALGQVDVEEGLPKLKEAVHKALELSPELAEAHARACQYFRFTGDPDRADDHWERARALEPNNPLVLGLSASLMAREGRLEDAVRFWRKAASLDPLSATVQGNLGHMLIASGRFKEAEVALRRAVELNPGIGEDTSRVAGFHLPVLVFLDLVNGRLESALGSVERMPPGPARTQYRALVYMELGRVEDAEKALARLESGGSLESRFRVAEVHAYRNQFDEAFRLLGELVSGSDDGVRSPDLQLQSAIRESPHFIPLRTDARWDDLWKMTEEG